MELQKKEPIIAARDNLLQMASLLQAVLDGNKTLNAAADDAGMSLTGFRQSCMKGFAPYIKKQLLSIDDLCRRIETLYSPGDRCLFDIFGCDVKRHQTNCILCLPDYDEDFFWEKVKERLSEKQYYVVTNFYGYRLPAPFSQSELARQMGLTEDRIRQIRIKSLRILRHPEFLRQIWLGISPAMGAAVDLMQAFTEKAISEYQEALSRYKKAEELTQHTQAILQAEQVLTRYMSPEQMERILSGDILRDADKTLSISDVHISVRAYNVLKRAGIKNLNDLIGKTKKDMRSMRNMGSHSYDEIQKLMLEHFGYTFPDNTDTAN